MHQVAESQVPMLVGWVPALRLSEAVDEIIKEVENGDENCDDTCAICHEDRDDPSGFAGDRYEKDGDWKRGFVCFVLEIAALALESYECFMILFPGKLVGSTRNLKIFPYPVRKLGYRCVFVMTVILEFFSCQSLVLMGFSGMIQGQKSCSRLKDASLIH